MKLKSAVKIAAIKAVYTQLRVTTQSSISVTAGFFQTQRISANIQTINRILADAQQGNFVYFAKYFDTYYIRDGARPSDELTFNFQKFFNSTDVATLTEAHFTDFGKLLGEVVSIADLEQVLKDFARPVFDPLQVSDISVKGIFKTPSVEELSVGDTLEPFLFGKNSFDSVGAIETLRRDMAKAVGDDTDQEYVADGYFFEDYIVGSPTEILATFDLFASTLAKSFSDSSSASDAFERQVDFSRAFNDSVFFTDDVDGAASILDDQEMQFFKFTNDAAFIGEEIDIVTEFNRDFADSAASTDSVARFTSKVLTNAFGVTDNKNVLTSKHIYDIPVVSDVLAKSTSSARSDSALLGDADTFALNKLLQDLTSTADAGSLRSQNYSDFTYFGEDFVGASRTF
jgi:hypothetical protein